MCYKGLRWLNVCGGVKFIKNKLMQIKKPLALQQGVIQQQTYKPGSVLPC